MHLCLAQWPALCERFRGQVKLHPLQVETQTCANGFDEALLQGLGRKGENIAWTKLFSALYSVCLCVCCILAQSHNNLRVQQRKMYAHMFNKQCVYKRVTL